MQINKDKTVPINLETIPNRQHCDPKILAEASVLPLSKAASIYQHGGLTPDHRLDVVFMFRAPGDKARFLGFYRDTSMGGWCVFNARPNTGNEYNQAQPFLGDSSSSIPGRKGWIATNLDIGEACDILGKAINVLGEPIPVEPDPAREPEVAPSLDPDLYPAEWA